MEFKGIMTGIGDKITGENIINPQIDAAIRNFIVGKDCILKGFSLNGNVLSAGKCLCQGYIGSLGTDITIPENENYIYGKFTVNHDPEKADSFSIFTSSKEISQRKDILHTAGTTYLYLYNNGILQLDNEHPYPLKAQNTDNTAHIVDGGTIGNNVTAPTQEAGNSSQKVANCEFVQNQIAIVLNEGDEMFNSIKTVSTGSTDWGGVTQTTLTFSTDINIHRKLHECVGAIVISISSSNANANNTSWADGFILATLNKGFRPIKTIKIGELAYGSNGFLPIYCDTEGKIKFGAPNISTSVTFDFTTPQSFTVDWKTNEG